MSAHECLRIDRSMVDELSRLATVTGFLAKPEVQSVQNRSMEATCKYKTGRHSRIYLNQQVCISIKKQNESN